eukprot:evm.model.scf_2506.1 EVM.evm.TU.scf_2506.1   scf_2506:380-9034(+)
MAEDLEEESRSGEAAPSAEELGGISDDAAAAFPTAEATLEFGWEDTRPLSGRRRAIRKERRQKSKPGTFGGMGLSTQVLKNIQNRCRYKLPTPIQRKTIPLILQGLDVVGMARTGSGKTAAFVIPMLERLKEHSTKVGARAVVLAPTRELALQTYSVVQKLGHGMGLRTSVLVGGDALTSQFAQLAANPDIIVAAPGRLMHMLMEVKEFSLRSVEYVVFDEADRLFEMGFAEQIKQVISSLSEHRQTLLFSATMPRQLAEFTKSGLTNPEVVRLDTDTMISPDLQLQFFTVRDDDKTAALLYLLREVLPGNEPTIIFASTRHHVEMLSLLLKAESVECAHVYGSMDQTARKIEVAKFRKQRVNILVVTDVAARGIDLPMLDNVIHFDFPPTPKLFVHRSGRAARAGRQGTAYSLLTREELPYLLDLHLFLSRTIKPAPEVPDEECADPGLAVYGNFPREELSDMCAVVWNHISSSVDLQGQLKSATNAFKLYLKTRPSASAESVRRVKDFPLEGTHPLFLERKIDLKKAGLKEEIERAAFAQKLKSFRPTATVFEAKVAPMRAAQPKNATSTMKDAMQMHEKTKSGDANERKRKRRKVSSDGATSSACQTSEEEDGDGDCAEEGAVKIESSVSGPSKGKYREDEFYISHVPSDRHGEMGLSVNGNMGGTSRRLDAAVLDLLGEDQKELMEHQRRYHWDKRHRKYVCLQPSEIVKGGKRVLNESGVRIDQKNGRRGIYEDWVRRNKTRLAAPGLEEDKRAAVAMRDGALQGLGSRYKKWAQPVVHADTQSELKTQEQVRKQRRRKERLREINKPKRLRQQKKGSKGSVAKKFSEKPGAFKKTASFRGHQAKKEGAHKRTSPEHRGISSKFLCQLW